MSIHGIRIRRHTMSDASSILANRATEFQALLDGPFRDEDGLLMMAMHDSGRALQESDLSPTDYNRPPYAGRGSNLLWHRYENTNWMMGMYLMIQAQRIVAGDIGGLAAGRAMLEMVLGIYFDRTRPLAIGHFGKPIVNEGGLSSYGSAPENNSDQMYGILCGLTDFHPFATSADKRRIEQMVVEIVDSFRQRNYHSNVRGRVGEGPKHAVHASKPMLYLLLANRFAPAAGFHDEYERWFEMNRRDPAVNATCLSWIYYQSTTGQIRDDAEVYAPGPWNTFVDVIGRLADADPSRRTLFESRLVDWWDEVEPRLMDDGRLQISMMVTPETRRWRPIRPNEIERGPYSCYYGAPIYFSGQWAMMDAVSVLEHQPALAPRVRPWLDVLLHKVDYEGLRSLWLMPGHELPVNLRGFVRQIGAPVMWLYAYWSARAKGLLSGQSESERPARRATTSV